MGALDIRPGTRVIDVACGTGNAALAAAERGATVLGIDGAERLVGVARSRAADAGLEARFEVGDATALPVQDDAFDAAVSTFGVIFADARAAAGELLRVVRPGGRIAFTAWTSKGPLPTVLGLVSAALGSEPSKPVWSDPEVVRELFAGHAVAVSEHPLAFTAPSLDAYMEDQFDRQPMWLTAADALREAGKLDDVMREARAALAEANEDPGAFQTTSTYLLFTVDV